MNLIFFLMNIMSMILCIPFLTLFERKILSYSQNRKGPNKISIIGMLQPMADGVKLIMKEFGFPSISNKIGFLFSPMAMFLLMVFSLVTMVNMFKGWSMMYSVLLFLVFSSISVFSVFFSAFSSNSKYTMLGAFRSAAQVVSYEISMILIILIPCCLSETLKFLDFFVNLKFMIFILPGVVFFWILSILAETNRAPFDFSEGESELVSGFNTEYGSLEFTFLFLGEYGNIVLMSLLSSIIFLKTNCLMTIFTMGFLFGFIWFRTTFPRFRYDLLMIFCWKVVLPFILCSFFFVIVCFDSLWIKEF